MYTLLLRVLRPFIESILTGLASDAIKRLTTKLRPRRDPSATCQSALAVTATYETPVFRFLVKELDPARKVSSYVPYVVRGLQVVVQHLTDTVIPIHPRIVLEVVNTLPDREVQLAPFIAVEILERKSIPGVANCLRPELATGVGADYDYFDGTLAPEQAQIFGALYTNYPASKFFRLRQEPQHFELNLTVMPGCFYTFRIGVVYRCHGEQYTKWLDQAFVAGRPHEADIWTVNTAQDTFTYAGRESMAMDAAECQIIINSMQQDNDQVQRVPRFTLPRPVAER